MALKGYIGPNVYVCITNTFYEKEMRKCTAMIHLYNNENKEILLANTAVNIEGTHLAPSLLSLTPFKTVPENLKDEYFLIADDAEDNLKGLEGRMAKKGLNGDIVTFILVNDSFLLYVEDEKKYRLYKDGEWIERPDMAIDRRLWDKWLAPEVALADGTNPTKQMYKFMKTLPLFKDCEDV
jgi:hypothetical protein